LFRGSATNGLRPAQRAAHLVDPDLVRPPRSPAIEISSPLRSPWRVATPMDNEFFGSADRHHHGRSDETAAERRH